MYESITVTGPTASGKTGKAVALAREIGGEIISADSRQIYTGMDLGTGKDLEEYAEVPYHLIDIVPAGEKYNLHRYVRDFREAYDDILSRGKIPVICGGTGMYLETALAGVVLPEVERNEELRKNLEDKSLEELTDILSRYKTLHNSTDVDTRQRAMRAIEIQEYYRQHPEAAEQADRSSAGKINSLIIALDISRDERRDRITRRLEARLEAGMVDEVKNLLDSGIPPEDLIYYGLEYKYLTLHAIGKLSYDEMRHDLEIAIHQFAKRQMTWFRGMERRGFALNWLPYNLSDDEFVTRVCRIYNGA
ncbi:MAG: tRNA (adenosine(37)-N6)-dimethylallyltransferase MiaA [Muribaculaceae bacterium]|nr:tRNA (adenosine(37)-N6)-dimethylallyltransferase MiaA [Muribaculaceae bacterium]